MTPGRVTVRGTIHETTLPFPGSGPQSGRHEVRTDVVNGPDVGVFRKARVVETFSLLLLSTSRVVFHS